MLLAAAELLLPATEAPAAPVVEEAPAVAPAATPAEPLVHNPIS